MAEILGKKWKRSQKIVINNPYNGIPQITFDQELVAAFDDSLNLVIGSSGSISEQMSNPAETFNLLNPMDGTTVIGSASYQEVYVLLYSLYEHLKVKYPNQ